MIFYFDAANGPYWLVVEHPGGPYRYQVPLADLNVYATNGFFFAKMSSVTHLNNVTAKYAAVV